MPEDEECCGEKKVGGWKMSVPILPLALAQPQLTPVLISPDML